MLSHERELIRHHNNGKEPWDFPMSLAHQAARQDPGTYLIAAACLGGTQVIAVPFQGEGSLFIELDLDDYTGNMRVARRRSAPGGRRLSLAFAGLSYDGIRVKDAAKSSWGKYVVRHAQSALADSSSASSVQVRSASALGSAVLCQLQWSTPHTHRNRDAVVCKDRALAHQFIQRTRADILRHLKVAFRELVMTEAYHLERDAYYATLGVTQAANDSNTNDEAPGRKRRRTRKWSALPFSIITN